MSSVQISNKRKEVSSRTTGKSALLKFHKGSLHPSALLVLPMLGKCSWSDADP